MKIDTALERVKDGLDCQLECASSLKTLKRGYPALAPTIDTALDQINTLRATIEAAKSEIEAIAKRTAAP